MTAIDEQITIEGHVAARDGSPIAGADVVLEPLSLATVTDGAGEFAFTVTADGDGVSQYVLEVRREGYETVSLQFVVQSGGTADLDVTLESISPGPDPDPEPEPTGIVVTSSSEDEVLCIAAGVELPFTVSIANEADAPVEGIVLHDTLDTGFSRILTASDIDVDRSAFPDAVVVLNPDGRSFRVELGAVPPMDPVEVYTVTQSASDAGVFCNRVSVVGDGGAPLSSDISCVTDTLVIEIDLVNEDGVIVGGGYTPDPEVFHVGDGGPDRPDALVYRVVVANHHCGSLGFPMGDSSLTSIVGARSGAVEFREVLAGFPSRGSIASSTTGGFVWSIGTLAPGEEAEIRFRAEAIQAGEDVHRIELTVPQLTGTLVNEEPIAILP
ncbi:MAG: carboxypeptidase-like regulatory domain-containing protein [Gemmatimonadota bacterium]